MRKTNILFLFALAGLFSLAACTGDEIANEENGKNSGSASAGMTFFSGEPSTRTRTSITHTIGGEGKVTWSDDDQIWVKDDVGNWVRSQQATFPIPNRKTNAIFPLNSFYSKSTHDVIYNKSYPATSVFIASNQAQSMANNFDHAGLSGDIGVAKAKRISAGNYKFTLEHKASYLCLLPRSSDPSVHRSKLVKIQILSDDTIAGNYNIDTDGSLIFDSNPSKEIILLLGGWSGTGFDIDNSSTDIEKNGAYAVIAPGTHHLAIRYFLKNTTDFPNSYSNQTGYITKYVTLNCEPGKIHDITSNLTIPDFSHIKYYQWDAQQSIGLDEENITMAMNDPRLYNDHAPTGVAYEGIHSATSAPNVNELCWYVEYGNTMRDDSEIWQYEGKLYAGGLWMKKKATIIAEQGTSAPAMAAAAPNGTDYRTVGTTCYYSKNTKIGTPADGEKYFFIPGLSYSTWSHRSGWNFTYDPIVPGGSNIYFWSSTVFSDYYEYAYNLFSGSGTSIEVNFSERYLKLPIFPLK